ncbi:calpain-A-like isoform X1 [Malaya genurostris]|uniref:calpain-A-like isoform X1 n=1 Tax=Malaya genurostris TaxID=325434 RepID=UPI0026F386C3|nr:calpain-A-like isoform X1 [Malaya genurostris]
MSFHNEDYNYPRNWQANGFGWVNPAAFNQSPYPQQMPTPESSGYSSLNPSIASSALSYGFAPGVVNPPSHMGYPPAPAANLPYPTMGFSGYGGMPMPNTNYGAPQAPLMPMPGNSYGSPEPAEDAEQSQEIPFQAVAVPISEGMFSSLGEKGSGFRTNTDVQDYYVLRSQCLENGSLFEDPEFPATSSSLLFSRRPDRHYEWLRPHEIADHPEFFVEGFSRFDVQQGELGDCWLLAACANLTRDQKLFLRVVPEDNSFEDDYAGIFHFRFWQYGRWVDVVIDDRLPTYRGELIYMRSSEKNEFWSALLEKAYAKLHGSYEALKGGTTCEAMEDFTGGVTEMYDLKDQTPSNLFQIMEKGFLRNSMFACSIEPDPNVTEAETPEGLIRGHAYSITKIQLADIVTPSTSGKIPLIRLRNPWGNEAEWNGAWSDQSPEWRFIPDEQKEELGLSFDVDGEFWMSYRDFIRYFDRVEICNLSPDSLSEEQESRGKLRWEMSTFEGEWAMGSTAGGCRNYLQTFWHNPQYVVHLEDPDDDDDEGKCTVIIALMQKNRRSRRNMGVDCLTIGFAVYRVSERDLAQKPLKLNFFKYNASVARSPSFINLREVSCRFKLPPGDYLIVPSTFEPNEEGEFLIRVFSENKNSMEENDEEVGVGDIDDRIAPDVPTPSQPSPQREALERLFLDVADADGEVDWVELKRILDHSFRDDLPKSSSVNGLNKTRANQQNAANYDGGGGNDTGGLLAQLCGLFCKDTPLAEAFGVSNGPTTADTNGNLQSDIIPIQHVDQVGAGFSKDVCRSMVAMLDVDQSGKLGFDEFKSLLTDIANWKAVFKLYDQDRTGRLSSFELRQALNSAGYHLNNRILNGLVHRYGSRDGSIAFDDFIMCAVKIKTMIEIFRERDTEGTNMATFSMDEWVEKTLYS